MRMIFYVSYVSEARSHLYRKIRPEFLVNWKVPLSSDAFCLMGDIGNEVNNT